MSSSGTVLVTGATGYVGGRLVPLLLARGKSVRCLVRSASGRAGALDPRVDVVGGDVLDRACLDLALTDVAVAYYLIHSMGSSEDFAERDRRAAAGFADAARRQGVERIIYLGGLAQGDLLSTHLASRHEVGRILRESGVPTLEFRASVIIGAGSLSFEMVRALVERLPVMVTPRWVRTLAQPIGIDDVLAYLLAALDRPRGDSTVYEIGGADRACYRDLMVEYARQRGLRRLMIPVPVLTPRLSSYWLRLVTPLYAHVGRKLIEGVRNPSIVKDDQALAAFPIRPRPLREQIAAALAEEDAWQAHARWAEIFAQSSRPLRQLRSRLGLRFVDSHVRSIHAPPEAVFRTIEAIGGSRGWYFANVLWRLRGLVDRVLGGPGLRRGRRDPVSLTTGDPVDFWRVEAIERPRLLGLRAEMKLPGRAWLQFEVTPHVDGSAIRATAIFDPHGVAGRAYWYLIYPLHRIVFKGMLRGLARACQP